MQQPEQMTIVNPDWVIECVNQKACIDPQRYHPKYVMLKPPTPPRELTPELPVDLLLPPHTPPHMGMAPRPMDLPLSNMGYGQPMMESPKTPSKSETSRTKEVLARMVSSRLQASGRIYDEPAPMGLSPCGSPRMGRGGSRPNSPRTLQNITNQGARSPIRNSKVCRLCQIL